MRLGENDTDISCSAVDQAQDAEVLQQLPARIVATGGSSSACAATASVPPGCDPHEADANVGHERTASLTPREASTLSTAAAGPSHKLEVASLRPTAGSSSGPSLQALASRPPLVAASELADAVQEDGRSTGYV